MDSYNDKRTAHVLLSILLILSSISYLGYWYESILNRSYIYFTYKVNISGPLSLLRYANDAAFIAVGVFLWLKSIHMKIINWVLPLFLWGIVGLIINGNFSMRYIVGGVHLPAMLGSI